VTARPELDSRRDQLEVCSATRRRWRDLVVPEGESVVNDGETFA